MTEIKFTFENKDDLVIHEADKVSWHRPMKACHFDRNVDLNNRRKTRGKYTWDELTEGMSPGARRILKLLGGAAFVNTFDVVLPFSWNKQRLYIYIKAWGGKSLVGIVRTAKDTYAVTLLMRYGKQTDGQWAFRVGDLKQTLDAPSDDVDAWTERDHPISAAIDRAFQIGERGKHILPEATRKPPPEDKKKPPRAIKEKPRRDSDEKRNGVSSSSQINSNQRMKDNTMSHITTQEQFFEAYFAKRGGDEGIKLARMSRFDNAPAASNWQHNSGPPAHSEKNDEWFELNPVGEKAIIHKFKSSKLDVVRGCVIHVDVDAVKYNPPDGEPIADHQEAADAHYASERNRIEAEYFNPDGSWKDRPDVPRPHIVINTSLQTGNIQLIWMVEPVNFEEGDVTAREHFEGYNRGAAVALGADGSVTDVCRLFRRPCSVNVARGKKASDHGRRVSPTGVRWFDEELPPYALEHFPHKLKSTGTAMTRLDIDGPQGHVAGDDAPHSAVAENALTAIGNMMLEAVGDVAGIGPGEGFEGISIHELIADRCWDREKGVALAALIVDGVDPGGHEDTSGSGSSHSAVHKLHGHGFAPDEIFMLMLNPSHKISYFARNDKGGAVRAIRRSLVKAMSSMGENTFNAQSEWEQNQFGKPKATSSFNYELAFHKLGVTFSFDDFGLVEYVTQNGATDPLSDGVVDDLWFSIERMFKFRGPSDLIWKVAESLCRRNRFNPVKDYFEGCHAQWVAAGRPLSLDGWLTTFAGAEASEFNVAAASIWVGAVVRRAFEPGCKFDEMMVLISPEGYDKSSLFEAMCPAKTYFTDSLVLTKTKAKDIIEDVTGKCIAEASDLSGLSGASREDIKNFLARSVDRGRVAYARKTVEIPRAWVAAGTTNRPEFLSGTDGNRRFWGIEVQRVKIDAFRKYAPLLLGEAYQRHVIDGQPIRLEPALYDAAAAVQRSQLAGNQWSDLLASHMDDHTDGFHALSVEDAYTLVGKGEPDHRQRRDGYDIVDAMSKAGWVKHRIRRGDSKAGVHCYVPQAKRDIKGRTWLWLEVRERHREGDTTIRRVCLMTEPEIGSKGQQDIPF